MPFSCYGLGRLFFLHSSKSSKSSKKIQKLPCVSDCSNAKRPASAGWSESGIAESAAWSKAEGDALKKLSTLNKTKVDNQHKIL